MQLLLILSLLSSFVNGAWATFQVRLSSAPNSLDWNLATTGSESAILQNIMEGLFVSDESGMPVPRLAKSFRWSPDRKILTIELRKDVKWTDGKPLIASHFVDSFKRLLDPSLNSENASLLFDVQLARDYFLGKTKDFSEVGIKAASPGTLVFTLREPRANFPSILTHWATFPIRKENLKLTLGPYQIVRSTAERIDLKAREKKLRIQNASFQIIPDGNEAIKAFKQKKLDYLLQLEDSLLTSPALTGLPAPGLVDPIRVVALLHLNPGRVVTNSPEKRRAIMKEIPVKALLEKNPKSRSLANSIIPVGLLGGPTQVQAPFQPMGDIGSLPKDPLTLAYPNDALSKSIAEEIQASTSRLKIKVEVLPKGEFSTGSKRYDLILTLFGIDYFDPDQLLSSFLSQGTHDLFNISSADFLKVISQARETENRTERGKLYAQAADFLQNKIAVVMPLFYRRRGFLLRESYGFDEKRQGTALLSKIHPVNH